MQRVLFFAFFLLLYEKAIPQFVRHLGRKKIWIPDTKTFSAPLPVGQPNANRLERRTVVPKIPLTTLRVVLSPEIPGSDFSVLSDFYGRGINRIVKMPL